MSFLSIAIVNDYPADLAPSTLYIKKSSVVGAETQAEYMMTDITGNVGYTNLTYQDVLNMINGILPTEEGLLKANGDLDIVKAIAGVDYVSKDTMTLFNKPQRPSISQRLEPVADNITWDLNTAHILRVKLTSDAFTFNITGLDIDKVGMNYQLIVMNDIGDLTFSDDVKWGVDGFSGLSYEPGKLDIFNFVVEETVDSTPTVPVVALFNIGYTLGIG